jgi:hypothetical protein
LNGGSRQSRIRRQVGFAICFLKLQWRNEQSVGVPDGPEERRQRLDARWAAPEKRASATHRD